MRASADDQADEVGREQTRAVERRDADRSGERDGDRDHRRQAGGRHRQAAQEPDAAESDGQAAGESDAGLLHEQHQAVERPEVVGGAPLDEADHEERREWIVEAALGLEDGGEAPADVRAAQRREDCRGVGRGDRGAEQERRRPAEIHHEMGGDRDDPGGHEDAERRQQAGGPEGPAHLRALGEQAALDQDDHERDGAGVARQRRVVELDPAGPVLAQQHAEAEEDEQRRRPETIHEARRDRADEEHRGRDDEWFGDVQRCAPSVCSSSHDAGSGRAAVTSRRADPNPLACPR